MQLLFVFKQRQKAYLFLPENFIWIITHRNNMANYELMAIVNPTISEEERNDSINQLKELFEKNSVKIEKEDVWADKKMAYKINKSERGFYILFDLDMDGKIITEISKSINLNANIWRYMFTRKEA